MECPRHLRTSFETKCKKGREMFSANGLTIPPFSTTARHVTIQKTRHRYPERNNNNAHNCTSQLFETANHEKPFQQINSTRTPFSTTVCYEKLICAGLQHSSHIFHTYIQSMTIGTTTGEDGTGRA